MNRQVAVGVLAVLSLALLDTARADCPPVTPSLFWKHTIDFPLDPFRVREYSTAKPDWVKFTIMLCDPTVVYFQDSNEYPFHYDFATEQLDPYLGISHADCDDITLYEAGQELVLGTVFIPTVSIGLPSDVLEFGVQFIRHDPYPPEQIVDLFNAVVSSVIAGPGVEAFYFPTYDQLESAEQHQEYLAEHGVIVSSPLRWADGDVCYSSGWALGDLIGVPRHGLQPNVGSLDRGDG